MVEGEGWGCIVGPVNAQTSVVCEWPDGPAGILLGASRATLMQLRQANAFGYALVGIFPRITDTWACLAELPNDGALGGTFGPRCGQRRLTRVGPRSLASSTRTSPNALSGWMGL